MKKLVLANNKGGVGKSSTATQFAHYLAWRGLKVLMIDLDHQGNTSKSLGLSDKVTASENSSYAVLTQATVSLPAAPFVLVPGTRELLKLEKQGLQQHNVYANNLKQFLHRAGGDFDVCVLDTNGNPDIRVTASLVVADFVLSPIQLNQEAIDGISDLLVDIKRIQQINPGLQFLGIVPNMVQATPFQRDNLTQVVTHFARLLIPVEPGANDYVHIPNRSVIAEAQAAGVPVWEIKKTAARDAWKELEPYFKSIAARMGLEFRS